MEECCGEKISHPLNSPHQISNNKYTPLIHPLNINRSAYQAQQKNNKYFEQILFFYFYYYLIDCVEIESLERISS